MTAQTARRILLANLVLSLVASLAIGASAETPAWSPVNWGIFFLAFTVVFGGAISLYLEWRATDGWRRPNPYAAQRDQVEEPVHTHVKA